MTDLDLLEKLEKRATPGPWEWRTDRREIHARAQEEYPAHPGDWDDDEDRIATVRVVESDGGAYGPTDADATLIVAMRNALPEMLEEMRAMRSGMLGIMKKLEEATNLLLGDKP
jgi:hypothetical protein